MDLRAIADEATERIESLWGEGCMDGIQKPTAILLILDEGEYDPGWDFHSIATPEHPDELWPINGMYRNDGNGQSVSVLAIPLKSVSRFLDEVDDPDDD